MGDEKKSVCSGAGLLRGVSLEFFLLHSEVWDWGSMFYVVALLGIGSPVCGVGIIFSCESGVEYKMIVHAGGQPHDAIALHLPRF